MYGIINRFVCHPGQRPALEAAMRAGGGTPEGLRQFILMRDRADPDVLWLTEVWDSKALWEASVAQPGIADALGGADALVRDWGTPVETEVV